MQLLLDNVYCDVSDKCEQCDDETALISAVAAYDYHGFSSMEVIKLLLDYGANKDIEEDLGLTAYDHAVLCDNQEAKALSISEQ